MYYANGLSETSYCYDELIRQSIWRITLQNNLDLHYSTVILITSWDMCRVVLWPLTQYLKLGIVLDCQTNTVTIDSICLPMQNIESLLTKHKSKMAIYNYIAAGEPLSTASEQELADWILDAKYKAADLPDIVKQCENLSLSVVDMRRCLIVH